MSRGRRLCCNLIYLYIYICIDSMNSLFLGCNSWEDYIRDIQETYKSQTSSSLLAQRAKWNKIFLTNWFIMTRALSIFWNLFVISCLCAFRNRSLGIYEIFERLLRDYWNLRNMEVSCLSSQTMLVTSIIRLKLYIDLSSLWSYSNSFTENLDRSQFAFERFTFRSHLTSQCMVWKVATLTRVKLIDYPPIRDNAFSAFRNLDCEMNFLKLATFGLITFV